MIGRLRSCNATLSGVVLEDDEDNDDDDDVVSLWGELLFFFGVLNGVAGPLPSVNDTVKGNTGSFSSSRSSSFSIDRLLFLIAAMDNTSINIDSVTPSQVRITSPSTLPSAAFTQKKDIIMIMNEKLVHLKFEIFLLVVGNRKE